MKFQWLIESADPVLATRLARAAQISPLVAQCLINRRFTRIEEANLFLEPRLRNLSDPFLVPGMEAAVERLFQAREQGQSVMIFGDYDVDGVTSTALLLEVLRALGWTVDHYLPHRQDDGYGLSRESVSKCLSGRSCKLLLAVDCGSSAVECVTWLKEQGVDVLVIDHHQLSDPLPPACALVNPRTAAKTADDLQTLPFTELCSAGLAFKVAHALVKRGRERGLAAAANFDVRGLLDLVALGTIADVVPLVRESRILAAAGLDRLSVTTRPGIVALKSVSGCPAKVGVQEVGFQLAPRLNAAGRLETAEDALKLLMAGTLVEATPIASQLHARNQKRQDIERQVADQVMARVRASFVPEQTFAIVEGDPSWHMGVVGVVASKVLHRFYRPTIILGGDGPNWRGSGRSVAGLDLAAALRECGDLLLRHGGHAMAAGVSMDPEHLQAFRARLNDVVRRKLAGGCLLPPLRIDAEVGLEEISIEFICALDRLRPFGQENPAPQFFARGLSHHRPLQRMGQEKQHVKLWVTDGTTVHEAVWWSAGNESLPVGQFDLAFVPQINAYNGQRAPQLKVLDWCPSGERGATAELRF